MSDFSLIEALFTHLLAASDGALTVAERGEVHSFIDVGEYGLALETTVDIYAEEGRVPSADVVSLIERLAVAMSMEPNLVLVRLRK